MYIFFVFLLLYRFFFSLLLPLSTMCVFLFVPGTRTPGSARGCEIRVLFVRDVRCGDSLFGRTSGDDRDHASGSCATVGSPRAGSVAFTRPMTAIKRAERTLVRLYTLRDFFSCVSIISAPRARRSLGGLSEFADWRDGPPSTGLRARFRPRASEHAASGRRIFPSSPAPRLVERATGSPRPRRRDRRRPCTRANRTESTEDQPRPRSPGRKSSSRTGRNSLRRRPGGASVGRDFGFGAFRHVPNTFSLKSPGSSIVRLPSIRYPL